MEFLDLFAGIGGFRLGMEQAGHKCVGYVELDKFARKSYQAMQNTKGEWTAHDIEKITNDDIRWLRDNRRIEVICGGFPCQSFSIAGKRGGFDDTRGTLFFEIVRIANIIRPRYLFLENVKGLLNHDNGNTFETILRALDELGYDAEWDVLNSKDFGVPHNRERVFIIGHLRGRSTRKVFPIRGNNQAADINVIGTTKKESQSIGQREVVYGTGGSMGSLTATDYKQPKRNLQVGNIDQHKRERKNPQTGRVYDTKGLSPSLTTMQGGGLEPKIVQPISAPNTLNKRQNGRRFKENGEPMFTLTARETHGVILGGIYTDVSPEFQRGPLEGLSRCLKANKHDAGVTDGVRIRKLTPKECWRLQGFPDELFEKAAKVNSDSQLYKQAGNSVTVNVIYEIAKKLNARD